jgi:hypothetical protein
MKHSIDALLDRDHVELLHLRRELGSSDRAASARPLFRQFAAVLGGHLTALRRVVYPAVGPPVPFDLTLHDAEFTHSFAELLTLKPDTAAFAEALPDLLDATARLVERERLHLLPWLMQHLDDAQRLSLALEAEPYLAPSALDGHGVRQQATDWIEEARLLLGGLAVAPESPSP